jgi:hypothetical protein
VPRSLLVKFRLLGDKKCIVITMYFTSCRYGQNQSNSQEKCSKIGSMWTHTSMLQRFQQKKRSVIRLWTLEQFNSCHWWLKKKSVASPWSKEIVETISILGKALLHRANENGFGQHYLYETMIIKLLDAKQQTTIFYLTHTYIFFHSR